GLLLELLDVDPVRLGEDLPVDVSGVVAWHVLAVLRELDREAAVRRLVPAGREALDHEAGARLQLVDLGEDRRVQVLGWCFHALAPHPPGRRARAHWRITLGRLPAAMAADSFGLISSSSRSTTRSGVMPSASAAKLVIRRWRSTGWATARMSSA